MTTRCRSGNSYDNDDDDDDDDDDNVKDNVKDNDKDTGLRIKKKIQGAQLHLQKHSKGVVYRNRSIIRLPAEI